QFPRLVEELKIRLNEDYRIIAFTANENLAHSLEANLKKEGLNPIYTDNVYQKMEEGQIFITPFSLQRGFEYLDTKTIFLTHHEIYGTERKAKKAKKKKSKNLLAVSDLNIDDYVVHENHGIGVYKGLEEIEISG